MRFADKVALVSGAGSGIGRATAEALAREGARVALLGRSAASLEATAAAIPSGHALITPASHESPAEAAVAVGRCLEAFGSLDVLVNNAGLYLTGTLAETDAGAWTNVLAANVTGPFVLTREALPHLRKARGAIVNISSSIGVQPVPGASAYCASKAALNMLTRTTALEEAHYGVRVNAICPGIVDTPIHGRRLGEDRGQVEAFLEQMAKAHPLGRVGAPEEVAALVLFLASGEASWITGAVIPIDGGISLT